MHPGRLRTLGFGTNRMAPTSSDRGTDPGYTWPVEKVYWRTRESATAQLGVLCELAAEPGVVHVSFADSGRGGEALSWADLEPWTRTRAVTVAELKSSMATPALDVALCADLVYLWPDVELAFPQGEQPASLVWALGRAGRAALARGLLDPTPIRAQEAVRLGLAQGLLEAGEQLPDREGLSLVALTTARDLMRGSVTARPVLEAASFRLLFASGDPVEGARAFLERRPPDFGTH